MTNEKYVPVFLSELYLAFFQRKTITVYYRKLSFSISTVVLSQKWNPLITAQKCLTQNILFCRATFHIFYDAFLFVRILFGKRINAFFIYIICILLVFHENDVLKMLLSISSFIFLTDKNLKNITTWIFRYKCNKLIMRSS